MRTDRAGDCVARVARLEDEDGVVRVFRKACSEGQAGRAAAYDNKVIGTRDLPVVYNVAAAQVVSVPVVIDVAVTAREAEALRREGEDRQQQARRAHCWLGGLGDGVARQGTSRRSTIGF